MAYRIALADSAKEEAEQIYEWIAERAPVRGPEWFEELVDCLHSLADLPYRCPLAREAAEARREIRCLLFGKRKHAYRILYEVDESRRTVWILHNRHGALRDLAPEHLTPPPRLD